MRYRAFVNKPTDRPLIVVDLGYSESPSSCGVTWTGRPKAQNHRFSVALNEVIRALNDFRVDDPILVLEAPLSGFHTSQGNPKRRGAFEKGRAWYCQPAATTCLGAMQFLKQLSIRLPEHPDVWLAEAFLSNKKTTTRHHQDAELILNTFWSTDPLTLDPATRPISPLIDGVPSVRVFAASEQV